MDENTTALPRAWFVNKLKSVESPKEALQHLNSADFTPEIYAILEETPDFVLGDMDTLGLHSISKKDSLAVVTVEAHDYHKVTIKTNSAEDAFLVVSEIYYPPDWKVLIDGEESKIYKTNFVLRGVFVPKGTHTVEFVLNKKIYSLSLAISLTALILVVATVITTLVIKKKKF